MKKATSFMLDEDIYRDFRKKCLDMNLEYSQGIEAALILWGKND